MSTYFRSAAMTLLSKTLQTLLYKYLSDVDVEGVELPSLLSYGGSDADLFARSKRLQQSGGVGGGAGSSGNGFGVRLSNVKLREGAQLMELPGKKKASRRPRHAANAKPKQQKRPSKSASSESCEGTPVVQSANSALHNDCTNRQPLNQAGNDNSIKEDDLGARHDFEEVLEQHTVATVAESDTETIATEKPMPCSSRSGWFFGWYSSSSSSSNTTKSLTTPAPRPISTAEAASTSDATEPLLHEHNMKTSEAEALSTPRKQEHIPPANATKITPVKEESYDQSADSDHIPVNADICGNMEDPRVMDHDCQAKVEDDEEEIDEDQPPFILRLGRNSRIGILDVRLVGKNVQVLVEDAFLTVEVVRIRTAPDPNQINHSDSAAASERMNPSATKAAAATTQQAPKKPTPEPKNVGERVLAENALARLFSSIPNLFLRDIHLRLVIRQEDEIVTMGDDRKADDNVPLPDYSEEDSVIDIAVEFLSVTDGEDFLAKFRSGDDPNDDPSDGSSADINDDQDQLYESSSEEIQNYFLYKRIRTGRGPEGGVTLRVGRVGDLFQHRELLRYDDSHSIWARQSWLNATNYHLLRCSGLDAQARIFLGSSKDHDESKDSWFAEADFSIDSMLMGGVDYIAPGPRPPLPPVAPNDAPSIDADKPWKIPGASHYTVDSNEIQSCSVASCFHRIARGLMPSTCKRNHFPCEQCTQCWSVAPGQKRDNEWDESTPMPGLAFHISLRDPLEVNVDRDALDIISLAISVFTKKTPPRREPLTETIPAKDSREETNQMDESMRSTTSFFSRSSNLGRMDDSKHGSSRLLFMASRSLEDVSETSKGKKDDEQASNGVVAAFPKYMTPEKIQIAGVYVSEIKFRVHSMRSADNLEDGLCFAYWELVAKCLTADYQTLAVLEKPFQDLRCDIGHLTLSSYTGNERNQLLSLGIRQRVVEFDDITVETLMTREKDNRRPPWPTTAAALLDIPPPLETLTYEARERHGIQFRYINVLGAREDQRLARSQVNLRLGAASVNAPFSIRNDVMTVITEATNTIFPPSSSPDPKDNGTYVGVADPEHPVDSVMKYEIRIDGGRIRSDPLIDTSLPMTAFHGELSTRSGLFFETMLDHIKIKFGKPASALAAETGFSIQRLADIPEQVRMRILMFLEDLGPLEKSLGVRPEPNEFLRYGAINKAIMKIARKIARSSRYGTMNSDKNGGMGSSDRRQELMTELMKMDDEELEDVWMMYQRMRRRR